MTGAEYRPSSISIAGGVLLGAGLWSMMLALIITAASFFLWVPAYTCGAVCGFWAALVGSLLLAGVKTGRFIAISACIAEMVQIVDCDFLGLGLAIFALVQVTKPESTAWFLSQPVPPAPAAGPRGQPQAQGAQAHAAAAGQVTGFEVDAVHNPLAWALLLTHPVITIDGVPHDLQWGRSFAPATPGPHRVHMHYPYFFMDGNPVTVDLTVHPGYITLLRYSAPIFVFQAGDLNETGHRPVAAALPPPQELQEPELPQPTGPA